MQAAELRNALTADPFRSFRLRFGSGKTVRVTNPGLVAVSQSGRTAFAFHPDDDGWDIIDVMLIESLEFSGNNGNGHTKKTPRKR